MIREIDTGDHGPIRDVCMTDDCAMVLTDTGLVRLALDSGEMSSWCRFPDDIGRPTAVHSMGSRFLVSCSDGIRSVHQERGVSGSIGPIGALVLTHNPEVEMYAIVSGRTVHFGTGPSEGQWLSQFRASRIHDARVMSDDFVVISDTCLFFGERSRSTGVCRRDLPSDVSITCWGDDVFVASGAIVSRWDPPEDSSRWDLNPCWTGPDWVRRIDIPPYQFGPSFVMACETTDARTHRLDVLDSDGRSRLASPVLISPSWRGESTERTEMRVSPCGRWLLWYGGGVELTKGLIVDIDELVASRGRRTEGVSAPVIIARAQPVIATRPDPSEMDIAEIRAEIAAGTEISETMTQGTANWIESLWVELHRRHVPRTDDEKADACRRARQRFDDQGLDGHWWFPDLRVGAFGNGELCIEDHNPSLASMTPDQLRKIANHYEWFDSSLAGMRLAIVDYELESRGVERPARWYDLRDDDELESVLSVVRDRTNVRSFSWDPACRILTDFYNEFLPLEHLDWITQDRRKTRVVELEYDHLISAIEWLQKHPRTPRRDAWLAALEFELRRRRIGAGPAPRAGRFVEPLVETPVRASPAARTALSNFGRALAGAIGYWIPCPSGCTTGCTTHGSYARGRAMASGAWSLFHGRLSRSAWVPTNPPSTPAERGYIDGVVACNETLGFVVGPVVPRRDGTDERFQRIEL